MHELRILIDMSDNCETNCGYAAAASVVTTLSSGVRYTIESLGAIVCDCDLLESYL